MSEYQKLLEERAAIDKKIAEARQSEIGQAITQIRALVEQFELTAEDIFSQGRSRAASATKRTKVAPKYRDPATGQTWTGRGKPPKWIANQNREKFAI